MKSLATAAGVGGLASLVTGRILDLVVIGVVATVGYVHGRAKSLP